MAPRLPQKATSLFLPTANFQHPTSNFKHCPAMNDSMLFPDGVSSKLPDIMMHLIQRCAALLLPAFMLLVPLSGQESGTAAKQYDSRALSHYLDGDLYMMQEDYRAAAKAYKLALSYDSSSATIYLSLGEALLRLGLLESSQKAGEKALRLQPDDPLVYEFLSRNAAAREDMDMVIRYLDRWVDLDPSDLEPLFRKAGFLLRQKKFAEAVDNYLIIYDRDPLQQQVLNRAGEIALSTGDLERAFQVYLRLYRSRPADHRVIRTYAEISVQTERFAEAIEAYELLEQSGGTTLPATLQLAWLYLKVDSLDKAQAVIVSLIDEGHRQWDVLSLSGHVAEKQSNYEQLARISTLMVEVYPDSVGGYTGLAIARNYLGDKSGAIEVLEDAVLRFPAEPDVNYLLGNLYFKDDRYPEAERHLLTALKHRPSASHIRHLLASTWSGIGKYGVSDSLYEVVLKADSKDAVAMNNYAYSIADRDQVSKAQLRYARRLSRKSLKQQPENAAFLDTYGWIWYRLKWYRTARKYIARSIDIKPHNPIVLDHLGEVYRKLGDQEKAKEYFELAEQLRQEKSPSLVRVNED
ncbi:MAG: tetratricopeptide repeat protein [Fidelibacterota bacterium]|nr:MAG: tetratricopeptide repeat protein [Candidatus Neomarinimicrobiota bacterium]